MRVIVFVCDKCGKAKGCIEGVKTSKCTKCGKTHSMKKVLRTRKVWFAKNEMEAKRIIQRLNWKKL